jgi:hypothetical protein
VGGLGYPHFYGKSAIANPIPRFLRALIGVFTSKIAQVSCAGAVHHNRSVQVAPEKIWSGHFLVEGRVRSMLGSGKDGLFLEGGINFFLDDTLTLKIKELDFNLGGYAALGYQKTLAERLLIMPTLQYRHNDFMTRENGLYLRLGLGYLLKD